MFVGRALRISDITATPVRRNAGPGFACATPIRHHHHHLAGAYLLRFAREASCPEDRGDNRQAADCYRKVIAFIREHPDDHEPGFEDVFVNLVNRLDPPTAI